MSKGNGKGIQWIRAHLGRTSDQCLRWPFAYDTAVGRGRLGYEGVSWWAHRLMCTLAHGPAPEGKPQVAHSCGNGHMGCVNPKHLSWSDQFENQRDRRKHGTAVTTRTGRRSKLTLDQIERIRALKGKQPQMTTARQFGISHANVRYWQGERDKFRTTPPSVRSS